MISKEIGEIIFESKLLREENDELNGEFIKSTTITNEYASEKPWGIINQITETRVEKIGCGNKVIDEGVSTIIYTTDENGNVISEKSIISYDIIDAQLEDAISYHIEYNDKNHIRFKVKNDGSGIFERTAYIYDERGFVISIICDMLNDQNKPCTKAENKIIKIYNISYNDDMAVSNIIVNETNFATMDYVVQSYTINYDINGYAKSIHLDGTDSNYDEYIMYENDDTMTIVQGRFNDDGVMICKTCLTFDRT